MIQGKLLSFGDDLTEVKNIRSRVFIDEFNLSKEVEFDSLDLEAVHVLVYGDEISEDNKPKGVATGRITYDGEICEIGHIAVLKEYRNNEYGDFTVRMLINRAMLSGIPEIVIYSPSETIGFFEKLGFVLMEDFVIDQTKDIKMVLNLKDMSSMCKCKH